MTIPVPPCRDPRRNPDDWFASLDIARGAPSAAATAMKLCRRCPIQWECLELAMAAEGGTSKGMRFGIFGGLGPTQRHTLHRRRVVAAREAWLAAHTAVLPVVAGSGDPPGEDVAA